jgi:periplasmic divalent cation tolerance protein
VNGTAAVQVQFAVDDCAVADRITSILLAERLVACAQRLGPVTSRYQWKGSEETAEEWLVLAKTRVDLAERVVERIVAAHPYEVPEVIVVPVAGGAAAYLDWVDEVTAAADPA